LRFTYRSTVITAFQNVADALRAICRKTKLHRAGVGPFLHNVGGKPAGREALKQLLDKLLSQPQRLPAE
jgi:hypothetical protein